MVLPKYLHLERIKKLNAKGISQNGKFVAYWVQSSQRTIYNHALEYAILRANELKVPLVAFFGITANYPNANQRPYHFMIQGLQQLKLNLAKRNIKFMVVQKSPDQVAIDMAKDAKLMIVDRGYLKIQIKWRKNVADAIECDLIQIESDVVVPVESASEKEEFAARTIRPKITSKISHFSTPVDQEKLEKSSLDLDLYDNEFDISDINKVIDHLKVSQEVSVVEDFKGGELEAVANLENFLKNKLSGYAENRNDPSKDATSNLSPYLHFGMISPVYIYNQAMQHKQSESMNSFLEELIVRRELSMNFCFYNENYDNFNGLPKWAQDTLLEHKQDKRYHIYTKEQLEQAKTHDEFWNASQREAIYKGKIAGYMRMYWGKKVIEWTKDPKEAYEILVYLNDKYHLDGRDANGYTGVAWCFGKHDRPWAKRNIFGTIRYMVDTGLQRKFNANGYVAKTDKSFREWRKIHKKENDVEQIQQFFVQKKQKLN